MAYPTIKALVILLSDRSDKESECGSSMISCHWMTDEGERERERGWDEGRDGRREGCGREGGMELGGREGGREVGRGTEGGRVREGGREGEREEVGTKRRWMDRDR